jgi:hypothetical protein
MYSTLHSKTRFKFSISRTLEEHQNILAPSIITLSDNATLHFALLHNASAQWRKVFASKSYRI